MILFRIFGTIALVLFGLSECSTKLAAPPLLIGIAFVAAALALALGK